MVAVLGVKGGESWVKVPTVRDVRVEAEAHGSVRPVTKHIIILICLYK